LRGPVEPEQYTSHDYTQTLDDHRVLASIGTVGDALDNALAESFVDSYKTELIADRVWRTRAQLELATVEYVGWFNHVRLHESLGDIPPVEFEEHHSASERMTGWPAPATTTSPAASRPAANGHWATAAPLPPVEMTSRGQPTNASTQADRPRGLPTGLGQPHERL
jgi:hypothetical protein